MPLSISTYVLGPVQTNAYLVTDDDRKEAILIDAPPGSQAVLDGLRKRHLKLKAIWITHAHFDHFGGVRELTEALDDPVAIGLHPRELNFWSQGGGGTLFGFPIPPQPKPTFAFAHGQELAIGSERVEVRHCPGHANGGQVIFHAPRSGVAFCGDVIFRRSIGRTDLPGGSHEQLLESIRTQILTLPPETRLLCGHGPETTVAEEHRENPFL